MSDQPSSVPSPVLPPATPLPTQPPTQLPTRLMLGALGVAAIAFGAWQILSHPGTSHPVSLVEWLVGALLVHDALIAPVVIGIGWLLARFVPSRARAFVQAGLVVAGLIASIGVLLIWRQGKYSATSLALLRQNYLANLLLLLAIVALGSAGCYLIAVLRSNRTNSRSPADQ